MSSYNRINMQILKYHKF